MIVIKKKKYRIAISKSHINIRFCDSVHTKNQIEMKSNKKNCTVVLYKKKIEIVQSASAFFNNKYIKK